MIASDLDRTLIFSSAWLDDSDVVCVERYKGAAVSYLTVKALARLRELNDLVPTTTRTIEQYQRVNLGITPRFAVTTNGGNILVDGLVDTVWRSQVENTVRATCASLDAVETELRERIDETFVRTFRTADDVFCYIVMHNPNAPDGFVEAWTEWCRDRGWTVSQQGRKIYAVPSTVEKSHAVAEIQRRTEASHFLAAGDGVLDREMLIAAESAIRPRHGELHDLCWTHPTVAITEAHGVRAGEEIVDWLSAAAE